MWRLRLRRHTCENLLELNMDSNKAISDSNKDLRTAIHQYIDSNKDLVSAIKQYISSNKDLLTALNGSQQLQQQLNGSQLEIVQDYSK